MNRGADRQDIFLADDDYRMFEWLMGNVFQRFGIEFHGYCLMTNHFHLLVYCPQAVLSASMQTLESAYARWINDRYDRDGPLFRGRFRSVLVVSDSQLLQLSRYIHRNPLSFVARADLPRYRWSSYGSFLGGRSVPEWLVIDEVAAMYGHDIDVLRLHVETDQPGDRFRPRSFVNSTHRLSLDELDVAIECETGVALDTIRTSTPGHSNRARLLAASLAIELRIAPARNVAAHYGLGSPQSVRNLARRGKSLAVRDATLGDLRHRVLTRLDDTD